MDFVLNRLVAGMVGGRFVDDVVVHHKDAQIPGGQVDAVLA